MNFQEEVMKIMNRHVELSQQQATALLTLTEQVADLRARIIKLESGDTEELGKLYRCFKCDYPLRFVSDVCPSCHPESYDD